VGTYVREDEAYFKSPEELKTLDDVSLMCLDFTIIIEEHMGRRWDVELLEGGASIDVGNDNISEYIYISASIRYRLFEHSLPQLTELLSGFFDVVQEQALTFLDTNKLEEMLHASHININIKIEEWQAMTEYSGPYEERGRDQPVVKWFWEIVHDEFDAEMRVHLLQFVMGTPGLPMRGLAHI